MRQYLEAHKGRWGQINCSACTACTALRAPWQLQIPHTNKRSADLLFAKTA